MQKRDVQALDLSPGFSDLEIKVISWKEAFRDLPRLVKKERQEKKAQERIKRLEAKRREKIRRRIRSQVRPVCSDFARSIKKYNK
jgi:hypothetical protein